LLNNQYGSDFDNSDFGGDVDGYRLSTASSYIGMPQVQMLASSNVEALDMESFLKGVPAANAYPNNHGLPTSNYVEDNKFGQRTSPFDDSSNFQLLSAEDDEAFWMNSFTSNPTATNNGRSEMPEENVWAQ
jgi:hypothetical protein